MTNKVALPRDSNQALGIGEYALEFMISESASGPSQAVLERTALFHTDAVLCGLSALALRANAPSLLREESLGYADLRGATVFGSSTRCKPEKAVAANCAAVREWDSNGTNFGYNPELGHIAGEFGHNDFYSVAVAACQERGLGGRDALKAMVLIDEIRGRLAEVFSLKTFHIDHVVYGGIASAAAYGAVHGASPQQIESAIGMFVAHYIPWRAIRAGKQLSDSKGASAALSAEAAVLCMKRSLNGFMGPRDIFRNPESLFRHFEPTSGDAPFDLVLALSGDGFAVQGMHFKIGLYEHQSAGGIQGVLDVLSKNPKLFDVGNISRVVVTAYEPAFSIIGDPAKRDPKTRQSADHSMVYILARVIKKACESGSATWESVLLEPNDYGREALGDGETRRLMSKIEFRHGGEDYDKNYPDGIPTSVAIVDSSGREFDSGLVMYPAGHARNTRADLKKLLTTKFNLLGRLALNGAESLDEAIARLGSVAGASPEELLRLYDFDISFRDVLD